MINNTRFKVIAGKFNKIPGILGLHDFSPKNARLHNKTTRSRPGRGQMFEAEAKILASRPLWPRGLNITGIALCMVQATCTDELTNVNISLWSEY